MRNFLESLGRSGKFEEILEKIADDTAPAKKIFFNPKKFGLRRSFVLALSAESDGKLVRAEADAQFSLSVSKVRCGQGLQRRISSRRILGRVANVILFSVN